MINKVVSTKYCCEDISKIENYDKAIADKTQTWHCHHRRETIFSRKELIDIGEYYDRPAIELIFLTQAEHNTIHFKNKPLKNATKLKMRKAKLGKHVSMQTKLKMSEVKIGEKNSMYGKHHSLEARLKISEAAKKRWKKHKSQQLN